MDLAVKGQMIAHRLLDRVIRDQRVSHAYLFEGPAGVGKEATAIDFIILAMDILDTPLLRRRIADGTHPDVQILRPDGANVRIDQIRTLRKEMQSRPVEGGRKAFIITDADRMTLEAANSLLKVLEEPPAYGLIVLLTSNLEQLLPTIRSRCQIIPFRALPKALIEQMLVQDIGVTAADAALIASLSEGLPGRARDMAESSGFQERRKTVLDDFDKIRLGTYKDVVTLIRGYEKAQDVPERLRLWSTIIRDILIWKMTQHIEYLYHPDLVDTYRDASRQWSEYRLIIFLEKLDNAHRLLDNNINTGLVIQQTMSELENLIRQEEDTYGKSRRSSV